MENVFISYAREDALFAKAVRNRLAEAGFATWLDLDRLRAGEDWSDEIDVAIRESLAMVVVLTPEAGESAYVTYEWAFAAGAGVRVIPLMLRPVVGLHPRLQSRHYLDFTRREASPWQELIEELRQAAASRQVHTIAVPRGSPPVIQKAIAALDSLDPEVQETAVQSLAAMRHPAVSEALAGAAEHPVAAVRREAAEHLAQRQDRRAIPGLIEAWLSEGRDQLRHLAASIGAAAVQDFCAALGDSREQVRRFAAQVLGELGDLAALGPLLQAASDRDPAVRAAAVEALGILAEQPGVRQPLEAHAVALLRQSGWSDASRTPAQAGPVAAEVPESERPGLPAPVIGGVEARRVIGVLRELLRDSDEGVRAAAATALGRWRAHESSSELLDLVRTDVREVVAAAALALGDLREGAAVPVLIEMVRSGTWAEVAAEALGRIGDVQAVPVILEAFLAAKDTADGRNPFALALGALGDERIIGPLLEALFPPPGPAPTGLETEPGAESNRTGPHSAPFAAQCGGGWVLSAICALGALGLPAVPALIRVLREASYSGAAFEAAEHLVRIGTPEALDAVRQWRRVRG